MRTPVTIRYKARLEYRDPETGKYHKDQLCNITHTIQYNDVGLWDTISFDWEPVERTEL